MSETSLIICPNCRKTYNIKLEQKGIKEEDSYYLSCHACDHMWAAKPFVHKPLTDETISEKIQPPSQKEETKKITQPLYQSYDNKTTHQPYEPNQDFLNTSIHVGGKEKKRYAGIIVSLMIMTTCVLVVMMLTSIKGKNKDQNWLWSLNSSEKQASLNIKEVKYDLQTVGKRQTILVVGSIENPASHALTLQPIQITVWGSANQEGVLSSAPRDETGQALLTSWNHSFEVASLEAGQKRSFQTVSSLPAHIQISRVDVTLP